MKMYMPLVATEDGIPHFVKQPGASLEPGDILGVLSLDDPTRVKHAKPFEGQLPSMGDHHAVTGSKPHQRLAHLMEILNNILDGFDNQAVMASTLKELMEVLHDQELPYSEVAAVLASLSGRLPAKLEETIRATIDSTKAKSTQREFPALRIKKIIDNFLHDHIVAQDREMVRSKISPLVDVVERYKNGLQSHEWITIATLLARYEATERLFGGSIEERVLKLREQHKDDLNVVAGLVLSHTKAQSKNKLVIALLDIVKDTGSWTSTGDDKLTEVMKELASLESK